jgi:aspartyl-tRNA(Asn)/glutamyl-tRNA(Gln) amidotransferase subunit A
MSSTPSPPSSTEPAPAGDPTARTARELLDLLGRGDVTAVALAEQYLDVIRLREPGLKAFLLVDEEGARAQARAVDEKRRRGESLGPLAGLPVALKDVLCTRGQRTTAGSKILDNFVPPYDAHVVERLRAADAVLIGKTNCDEFAMGSSTENSAFGPTRNPWDAERVPGGSSGGSAAAVAAGECPLSLGSDTGGSIRQPAALCGVVGVKPSYGRVSRFGLVAFASSLDQVGPFAHTAADAALLLEVIAGHDRRDSTSVDRPVPPYSRTVDDPVRPLTIGVPREYFGEALDPEVAAAVREALEVYRGLGAKVEEVSLPHSPVALATYYLVATAEASSNLARYDGVHFGRRARGYKDLVGMYERSRGEGFGAEVKRRVMLGTYALSSGYKDAYYLKALRVRRLIRNDFDQAFARCDVLMGPTSPTPAFRIGERSDPLQMYLADVYTVPANLAGICGVSLPCGFKRAGLPVGLQILAAPFEEEKLLRVARMYERATDWHTRRPPSAHAPS